jgi:hypothetical protein
MSDSTYLFDNAAEEAGQRFDALAALFNAGRRSGLQPKRC